MKTPSVDSKTEILEKLAVIKARLMEKYPIHSFSLFGSRARGDARADSDIDLLVDVDPSIGLRMVNLAGELEEHLGYRVDLVSKRALKPLMLERISKEIVDA